jgi:hypothetical protein
VGARDDHIAFGIDEAFDIGRFKPWKVCVRDEERRPQPLSGQSDGAVQAGPLVGPDLHPLWDVQGFGCERYDAASGALKHVDDVLEGAADQSHPLVRTEDVGQAPLGRRNQPDGNQRRRVHAVPTIDAMRIVLAAADPEATEWLAGILGAEGFSVVVLPEPDPAAPELRGAELLIADESAASSLGDAGPARRMLLSPRGGTVDLTQIDRFADVIAVPSVPDEVIARVRHALET